MVNIDKIKNMAKEKGITITHLCQSIGQGAYYFNDVKKRNGNIPQERLAKIAEILNTSVQYLTDQTDDPSPNIKESETDTEISDSGKIFTQDELRKISLSIVKKMSHEELEHLFSYFVFMESDEYEFCMQEAESILKNSKTGAQLESDYMLRYSLAYIIAGFPNSQEAINLLTKLFD